MVNQHVPWIHRPDIWGIRYYMYYTGQYGSWGSGLRSSCLCGKLYINLHKPISPAPCVACCFLVQYMYLHAWTPFPFSSTGLQASKSRDHIDTEKIGHACDWTWVLGARLFLWWVFGPLDWKLCFKCLPVMFSKSSHPSPHALPWDDESPPATLLDFLLGL